MGEGVRIEGHSFKPKKQEEVLFNSFGLDAGKFVCWQGLWRAGTG